MGADVHEQIGHAEGQTSSGGGLCSLYFDRAGHSVDANAYQRLINSPRYRIVAEAAVGGVRISTGFNGDQTRWHGKGRPPLFTVAIHGGRWDGWTRVCLTEKCALDCHQTLVTRMRKEQQGSAENNCEAAA